MILNFLKSLNERTKNIISWIINILIVTVISSLILCLIIGSIGHFANLSFMISLISGFGKRINYGWCLLLQILKLLLLTA